MIDRRRLLSGVSVDTASGDSLGFDRLLITAPLGS
jgi:hypothetical protein